MTIERRDIDKDDYRQSAEEPALEREEVGYRRPPKEHTIKKGEVRNPWGRPGKPKPEIDFLDERIPITINGQREKITRARALDEALFQRAMRGSVSAVKALEQRAERRRAAKTQGVDEEAFSADDEQIYECLIEREVEKRLRTKEGKS
jgi:hypothetical protein